MRVQTPLPSMVGNAIRSEYTGPAGETAATVLTLPIQPAKYISALLYSSRTTMKSSDGIHSPDGPPVALGKQGLPGFHGLFPPVTAAGRAGL